MPMTWPFLSSMRNAAASSTTSQATAHLTPAQQLLLAPRTVHRRRYCKNCIVVRNGICSACYFDNRLRANHHNPQSATHTAQTNAIRCSVTTTITTTSATTRACFVLLLRASQILSV